MRVLALTPPGIGGQRGHFPVMRSDMSIRTATLDNLAGNLADAEPDGASADAVARAARAYLDGIEWDDVVLFKDRGRVFEEAQAARPPRSLLSFRRPSAPARLTVAVRIADAAREILLEGGPLAAARREKLMSGLDSARIKSLRYNDMSAAA